MKWEEYYMFEIMGQLCGWYIVYILIGFVLDKMVSFEQFEYRVLKEYDVYLFCIYVL